MLKPFLTRHVLHCLTATTVMLGMHAASAEVFETQSLLFARMPPAVGGLPGSPVFSRLTQTESIPAHDETVPIGSLWKLFVYAYAAENAVPMPDYRCREKNRLQQEVYCCDPGMTISKDAALAQSCGLFFDPQRLKIRDEDWTAHWHKQVPDVPWLAELHNMQPSAQVSISSLLQAMSSMNPSLRKQMENALMGVVLNGRGKDALGYLGGRYRIKTYTWSHPQQPTIMVGGGAGWLQDGSAVWFGAIGSSAHVLRNHAPQLAKAAEVASSTGSDQCVEVNLFTRYPLKQIQRKADRTPVLAGDSQLLNGVYLLKFANGKSIDIYVADKLEIHWLENGTPSLLARMSETEYVARVIDREADTREPEAARAIGIVARTYLYQNAKRNGHCLAINDSTKTQRVSPNPASAQALHAASFSDGLLLDGVQAQYRTREEGRNILSWKMAREMASGGARYNEILRHFFPDASLATISLERECQTIMAAETWLKRKVISWRSQLQMEPGFTEPAFQVCRLHNGKPHSDIARQRIYVNGIYALNDHITLAHEYLHLAFASYPTGQDEQYIERWARRLIEGDPNI